MYLLLHRFYSICENLFMPFTCGSCKRLFVKLLKFGQCGVPFALAWGAAPDEPTILLQSFYVVLDGRFVDTYFFGQVNHGYSRVGNDSLNNIVSILFQRDQLSIIPPVPVSTTFHNGTIILHLCGNQLLDVYSTNGAICLTVA